MAKMRYTDEERRKAARVLAAQKLSESGFDAACETALAGVRGVAASGNRDLALGLLDEMAEQFAEAVAEMRAEIAPPAELKDADRNASRWPGGHNHAPGLLGAGACTVCDRGSSDSA